ncbi:MULTISPECIES: universal stress protein [unclassified Aureispira]|uniref:universal stress protein n=1 Tax=unclassified Aureispira TaxID=2649989 RepID=UPI00069660A4|nr:MULTISPECIES: universal stress protein [unclassified Aureispira]WMX12638.1 universal stress protein [Aureispira sp. CCB-E]
MKNILSATDFSSTANKAVDYASMIAKGQKTPVELKLLNVYHIKEELKPILSEEYIEKLSRHELFDLAIYKQSKNLPAHVSLKGVLRKGPVVETILQEARESKSECIVIGRNGHSGVKNWLLGNNTLQLIEKSEIPVMVIPRIAIVQPPKKIAIAIDDRFVPSNKTLAPIYELVDRFNTELVLFHVEQEAAHSNTHKETAIQIARKGYQINLYKMDSENPTDALLTMAEEHQIDLLCLIKHDYTTWQQLFHKSTSSNVATKSKLPFIILKDQL